jgi:hypothetical protein
MVNVSRESATSSVVEMRRHGDTETGGREYGGTRRGGDTGTRRRGDEPITKDSVAAPRVL